MAIACVWFVVKKQNEHISCEAHTKCVSEKDRMLLCMETKTSPGIFLATGGYARFQASNILTFSGLNETVRANVGSCQVKTKSQQQ